VGGLAGWGPQPHERSRPRHSLSAGSVGLGGSRALLRGVRARPRGALGLRRGAAASQGLARAPSRDVGLGHRRALLGARGAEPPPQARSPQPQHVPPRGRARCPHKRSSPWAGEVLAPRRAEAKGTSVRRTRASSCHGYHVELSSGASHARSYRNST